MQNQILTKLISLFYYNSIKRITGDLNLTLFPNNYITIIPFSIHGIILNIYIYMSFELLIGIKMFFYSFSFYTWQ